MALLSINSLLPSVQPPEKEPASSSSPQKNPSLLFPECSYYSAEAKCFFMSKIIPLNVHFLPLKVDSIWRTILSKISSDEKELSPDISSDEELDFPSEIPVKEEVDLLSEITSKEEVDVLKDAISFKYHLSNSITFNNFWHFHIHQLFRKVAAGLPEPLKELFTPKMENLRLKCTQNVMLFYGLNVDMISSTNKEKALCKAQTDITECYKEYNNFCEVAKRYVSECSKEYKLLLRELKVSISITKKLIFNNPETTLTDCTLFNLGHMSDRRLFPTMGVCIKDQITENEFASVVRSNAIRISVEEAQKIEDFDLEGASKFTAVTIGAPLCPASFQDYLNESISCFEFLEETYRNFSALEIKPIIDQLKKLLLLWESNSTPLEFSREKRMYWKNGSEEQMRRIIAQTERVIYKIFKKYEKTKDASPFCQIIINCQKMIEQNIFSKYCDDRFKGVYDRTGLWKDEFKTLALRYHEIFSTFPKNDWEKQWFKTWEIFTESLFGKDGLALYQLIIFNKPEDDSFLIEYAYQKLSFIETNITKSAKKRPQITDTSAFYTIDVNSVYASYLFPMVPYFKLRTLISDLRELHSEEGFTYVQDELYNWPEDLIQYVLSLMETIKAACPPEKTIPKASGEDKTERQILREKLIEILYKMNFFIEKSHRPCALAIKNDGKTVTISRQKTEQVGFQ